MRTISPAPCRIGSAMSATSPVRSSAPARRRLSEPFDRLEAIRSTIAMKVTVAATQFACTDDRAANLATAERLIREAARQGANIILIQELFETPYFCKEHDPKYFDVALPIEENPAVRRFQQLARELNVVLPASVYRARRQRVLQLGRDHRCRRRAARHVSQGAHSGEPGLSREVLFLARRHRLQGVAHALRHDRRRDLLGPVVPRIGARHGAARRGDPVLSDCHRLGAAGPEHRFARSLAARDAGPRGVEHHAGGRVQSHRHRARRALGSHLLRLVVHHRSHRRDRSRRRRAPAKRSSPRRSISTRSAPIARRGACSAIAARSCTGRCMTLDGQRSASALRIAKAGRFDQRSSPCNSSLPVRRASPI